MCIRDFPASVHEAFINLVRTLRSPSAVACNRIESSSANSQTSSLFTKPDTFTKAEMTCCHCERDMEMETEDDEVSNCVWIEIRPRRNSLEESVKTMKKRLSKDTTLDTMKATMDRCLGTEWKDRVQERVKFSVQSHDIHSTHLNDILVDIGDPMFRQQLGNVTGRKSEEIITELVKTQHIMPSDEKKREIFAEWDKLLKEVIDKRRSAS